MFFWLFVEIFSLSFNSFLLISLVISFATPPCHVLDYDRSSDSFSFFASIFNPTIDPSRLFERIGSQRCVRMQIENTLTLSLSLNNRFNLSETMIGSLKGFSNPSSPEFVTRVITESSTIPNSYNILTLSLVANFKILVI